jgi:hypothetical protein
MTELLDKILLRLRDMYPQCNIEMLTPAKIRVVVYVDGKKMNEFNPEILERSLEFLKDRPDYIDLFIQAIKAPIDEYLRKKRSIGFGRHSKGLSLQQIQSAISNSQSCAGAARYLHVNYSTFKKYAKMYKNPDGVSLFEKHLNEGGIGIRRGSYSSNFGRLSLQDIFDGKASKGYPNWRLKSRLIKNSVIEEKCSICGFEERRVSDYKIPLELDFIDGNPENKKLENLRLLCYNCYLLNVGDLYWRTQKKAEYKKKN